GYIGVGPMVELAGDRWLLALGGDYEPRTVNDLRLIWSLRLNRNPFGVFGFSDVQSATEAKDADLRDIAVQHRRSFRATAGGAEARARIGASGQPTLRPAGKP